MTTALRRTRLRVVLDSDPDRVIDVECINPDFLRIESAAPKFGLALDPKGAPMTYMSALGWAALKRTGDYLGEWPEFKAACLDLEVVKEGDEVDPTTEGRGTPSPSPSPSTTGTPGSGSPSTTND